MSVFHSCFLLDLTVVDIWEAFLAWYRNFSGELGGEYSLSNKYSEDYSLDRELKSDTYN